MKKFCSLFDFNFLSYVFYDHKSYWEWSYFKHQQHHAGLAMTRAWSKAKANVINQNKISQISKAGKSSLTDPTGNWTGDRGH